VIAGVPFVAQEPERCGPAALTMVLRFHGADVAEPQVAAATHSAVLQGALVTDLAACARALGYRAEVARERPEALRAAVEHSRPVILLLDVGRGPIARGHYAVLFGYDAARGRYLIHSGRRAARWVPAGRLERQWKRGGGVLLEVSPS
jgi:ABC-type bacteriocin/lantibiotic exporter with double-glycine peptidase domain